MPPNPIIQAILEAGKKAVESARRTFQGEFHTGHLSPEHVHLPNDRQMPRLLDPEELRRREQVRAAEDQAVFDALDNIAMEGFHTPSHNPAEVSLPRPRLTAAELAAMTPEERNRARAMEAANEIQELEDAEILRTLESAGSHVSPGLIPGTLNIQAPMQVSRLVPGPDGRYVEPPYPVGPLRPLTREDLTAIRQEIERYDIRESAQPILIPGRTQGEMTLTNPRVNLDAMLALYQRGNLSVDTIQEMFNLDVPPPPPPDPNVAIGVYNPRGISRLELYREARTIEPVREVGNEGFAEFLLQAAQSELPPVRASQRVLEAIRAGQNVAVSMGTRVENPRVERDAGRTPPPVEIDPVTQREILRTGLVEPRVWAGRPEPVGPMPPRRDLIIGESPWPPIDGPTPNWVNAADPNAVVPHIRAERVIFPTFEMAANPTVPLTEIRARRFDIIERNDSFGHTDYTQDIPSAALHKEPHRYEGPRPSVWEKITGDELIDDPFTV